MPACRAAALLHLTHLHTHALTHSRTSRAVRPQQPQPNSAALHPPLPVTPPLPMCSLTLPWPTRPQHLSPRAERPQQPQPLHLHGARGDPQQRRARAAHLCFFPSCRPSRRPGLQGRSTSRHVLNDHSSRSHCIFTVHVEIRNSDAAAERAVLAKMHLVDLAGSERTKKTNATGQVGQTPHADTRVCGAHRTRRGPRAAAWACAVGLHGSEGWAVRAFSGQRAYRGGTRCGLLRCRLWHAVLCCAARHKVNGARPSLTPAAQEAAQTAVDVGAGDREAHLEQLLKTRRGAGFGLLSNASRIVPQTLFAIPWAHK